MCPEQLRCLAFPSGENVPTKKKTPHVFTRKLHTWDKTFLSKPDNHNSQKLPFSAVAKSRGKLPPPSDSPDHSVEIPPTHRCSSYSHYDSSLQNMEFLTFTGEHLAYPISYSIISYSCPFPHMLEDCSHPADFQGRSH